MTAGDGKRVPGWRRWTEDVPGASPPGPQRCGRGQSVVGVAFGFVGGALALSPTPAASLSFPVIHYALSGGG